MQASAYELNFAAAPAARARRPTTSATRPRSRATCAGALGPTTRTASISPDVNDPAPATSPSTSWATAYLEARRGACSTAASDLLLLETIFDTLERQGRAVRGRASSSRRRGARLPVIISGTITDASGRTLSGQTAEAFWDSVRHAQPARGRPQLRPRRRARCGPTSPRSRGAADTLVSVLPERRPAQRRSARLRRGARRDRGRSSASSPTRASSTSSAAAAAPRPTHIAAIARAVEGKQPREAGRRRTRAMRLSGLEPLTITDGQPASSTSASAPTSPARRKFRNLIKAGDYDAALAESPRQQVENGAQIIDVNMDEGMLDGVAAMDALPQPDRQRARHRARAAHGRHLEVGGHRGRPEDASRARPSSTRSASRRARRRSREQARLVRRYGAAAVVMAFDEDGPGRQPRAPQGRDLRARLPDPARRGRLPARGHHLRPQHLRRRHRHRGARGVRASTSSRPTRWIKAEPARRQGQRRHLQRDASPSAATTPCARPSTRSSSTTPSRRAWTWASSTPGTLVPYERGRARAARARSRTSLLNRRPDATERLLEIAEAHNKAGAERRGEPPRSGARCRSASGITHALVKGIDGFVEADTEEAPRGDRREAAARSRSSRGR